VKKKAQLLIPRVVPDASMTDAQLDLLEDHLFASKFSPENFERSRKQVIELLEKQGWDTARFTRNGLRLDSIAAHEEDPRAATALSAWLAYRSLHPLVLSADAAMIRTLRIAHEAGKFAAEAKFCRDRVKGRGRPHTGAAERTYEAINALNEKWRRLNPTENRDGKLAELLKISTNEILNEMKKKHLATRHSEWKKLKKSGAKFPRNT
jgi:hypothetical protein